MKDHTVNAVKGIPDFAYISFDQAYRLAGKLAELGGAATIKELCGAIVRNKTGWLGLEVKSMRVWGLVSGYGIMKLTNKFHKLTTSKDPNEKLEIKKNSFLDIPLFKLIFEKYSNKGLPKKAELINFLESEHNINPTYSPSVTKTIIDSIQKYFKEYGKGNIEIPTPKKETEDLSPYFNVITIKVTSPVGNFDLKAANKKDFEKIFNILNKLFEEQKL